MKTIFVILDGAADLPCKKLNWKTPLEAANKPNLDYFTQNGVMGQVQTVGKNIAPESDVAVFALLGYNPFKSFSGRGPLEASGAGIKLGKHFLAFRTNFATANGEKIIERRAGRNLTTSEANKLTEAINKYVKLKCKFIFKNTVEHRGILVLYGKFSNNISNVDPAYEKEGNFGVARKNNDMKIKECRPLSKNAKKSAELVNEFVRQSKLILEHHPVNQKRKELNLLPANVILPRDAGNKMPKIKKKSRWAAIVGMPLEIGIAELAGMKILRTQLSSITSRNIYDNVYASLFSSLKQSVSHLKSNWNKHNNFYIHIKETDIPGHDGLPIEKKGIIEIIDREFFSELRKLKNFRLIVTSDHSTPCSLKSHSDDPVPLLAYGFRKENDGLLFSEKNARHGSLKLMLGKDVLNKLMKG